MKRSVWSLMIVMQPKHQAGARSPPAPQGTVSHAHWEASEAFMPSANTRGWFCLPVSPTPPGPGPAPHPLSLVVPSCLTHPTRSPARPLTRCALGASQLRCLWLHWQSLGGATAAHHRRQNHICAHPWQAWIPSAGAPATHPAQWTVPLGQG